MDNILQHLTRKYIHNLHHAKSKLPTEVSWETSLGPWDFLLWEGEDFAFLGREKNDIFDFKIKQFHFQVEPPYWTFNLRLQFRPLSLVPVYLQPHQPFRVLRYLEKIWDIKLSLFNFSLLHSLHGWKHEVKVTIRISDG